MISSTYRASQSALKVRGGASWSTSHGPSHDQPYHEAPPTQFHEHLETMIYTTNSIGVLLESLEFCALAESESNLFI